jgi:hypothetical protein
MLAPPVVSRTPRRCMAETGDYERDIGSVKGGAA